jgi:carboxypeptidase family protein
MRQTSRAASMLLLTVVIVVMAASPAWAQLYSGTISGVVQDPSGAVVAKASLTLTDVTKNFKYQTTSDSAGRYFFRSLQPSVYSLKVQAVGFSAEQIDSITLNVNGDMAQDVTLKVGKTSETVEVSQSGAAQVQSEDASTGQTIDRKFVNDLPLIGRSVGDLAYLAPGVSQPTGTTYGPAQTIVNSSMNNFVSEGSRNAQADIVVDGVSTTNYDQNSGFVDPLYSPSVDAVQEFKIQQTNFSAEFGFSGATVINLVTRSGTNKFHGSLYEFWRETDLNANNYFNNEQGIPNPPYHWNDFGGTIGGPIVKDRLFFFFDYEGSRTITPTTKALAVPTLLERQGNLGEICTSASDSAGSGSFATSGSLTGECVDPNGALLQSGQIYDPYSIDPVKSQGGNPYHDNFVPYNNLATYASAGNANAPWITPGVVGNLFSPVVQAIFAKNLIPNPNILPGAANYNLRQSNYLGNAGNTSNGNGIDVKLDYRLTQNDQVNFRVSHNWGNEEAANLFGTDFDTNTQGPNTSFGWSGALSYDHIFSPKTLFTASLGYIYTYAKTAGPDTSWDPTSIGMAADLGTASGVASPPALALDSYASGNSNATYGGQPWSSLLYAQDVGQLVASVSHSIGGHDLKFGGEIRRHRINFTQWELPGGRWEFNQNATDQQFNNGGDSMASFLIGYATGWDAYSIPASPATQNFQYAGFVQDNWHVNKRLTLNLGLRYDVDMPRTERHNRMSYFDPNAASVVPGLKGSFEYAGLDGNPRTPFDTYWDAVGPRIGLAFRIDNLTVLRGGYGIYYDPSKGGAAGIGSGGFGFAGYDDQNSPYAFVQPSGLPQAYPASVDVLGQPASTAFEGTVIGNSLGNKFGIGELSAGSAVPVRSAAYSVLPREQSWSVGIEREVGWNVLVDAEYIGKKGSRLYMGGDNFSLNHLPDNIAAEFVTNSSALNGGATIPAAVQAGVEANSAPYSNGFWGGQWPAYNAYLPFPQYGTTTWGGNLLQNVDPPIANSIYNGFSLRVEKRFSQGLQFLATYTNQKSIDNASIAGNSEYITGGSGGASGLAQIQDPNCIACERTLSQYDISQIAQFSAVYALPFGRGKHFGGGINPWVDAAFGNWQLNGIYRWDTGLPLILYLNGGTSVPTFGNQRPDLNAPLERASNWSPSSGGTSFFSCGACATEATKPAPYALGTAPRVLPNIRAPGTNNFSMSIFKEFPLQFREGANLQFRAETFNTFNHVQFGAPNTTVDGGAFGEITGQANSPRILQLALKLYF